MNLKLVLLITISSFFSFAQAQDRAQITGRVITSDGSAASNISVTLKGTRLGASTNAAGDYLINNIKPGTYIIRVSALGVQAQEKEITLSAGDNRSLDFVLSTSYEQLQEVSITTGVKKYKSDQPSSSLRINEPLIEIPQNIQIVTSGTLTDQQVISMSDNLIRNVSGANRVEHWGDLFARITMRGSQIQAFRNGFNAVNSSWGPLTEDMSFVDHIEFVKGPAGFMLSNGDPSGLYNVVTKKPTGQNKGEASITLGSYDLYRATLDLDGKITDDGKLLYRLNLAGQNKNSHRAYEYNDRYVFAPVISYQIDEKTKLTAEYTLQYAKMSNVGSYYVFDRNGYGTRPVDFTSMSAGLEPTKINDNSVFLNLQHQLNDKWKLTAQAAYFNYKQVGSSMFPASVNASNDLIRSVTIWDAKSEMTMAQVFLNGDITTGAVRHRILSGIDMGTKDYMADWGQSFALDSANGGEFNVSKPNRGVPVNGFPSFDRLTSLEVRAATVSGLIDQRYTGLYLQDELGLLDNRLRLTLAGRYTYVSQSQYGGDAQTAKHFTPRFGLSVSLDKQTSVYAMYDQAFIPQSGILRDGGDVKPITGNNIEAGIKKDWFSGSWNTTLSVYRILKNNELTGDPDQAPGAPARSIVMGQKRAQGIEFDIRGEIISGLNLTANYAYTDSKITELSPGVSESTGMNVGDVVPGYSKHTVNSWLNYKLQSGALKGTGISAGFSWLIDRATDTWSASEVRLPDYFRLDGGLFWQKNNITITGNAFNILDKYLYSGSYYSFLTAFYWQTEAPRNYRVSVAYKF